MSEEHKNCKYRFKGKSCEDCPLNCKFKRLQEENKELKKLKCKFKEYCTCDIEKYRSVLEEIREIAKYSIMHNSELNSNYQIILQNINEVLNDRN